MLTFDDDQERRLRIALDAADRLSVDQLISRAARFTATVEAAQEALGVTTGSSRIQLVAAMQRLRAERGVVNTLLGVRGDERMHDAINAIGELMDLAVEGKGAQAQQGATA